MKFAQLSVIALLLLTILALSGHTKQGASSSTVRWSNGLSQEKEYFPIAVWLQDPSNASKYKAAGFNLYVALWKGPMEAQLSSLKSAGMRVICEQNAVGLAHRNDPTIAGWIHGDEPDNAQEVTDPVTGKKSYGPCIAPSKIVADYARIHAADPTRPIMLNLGQGVANDNWVGRGTGAKLSDYETYINGGDIVSFDVYPVADLDKANNEDYLWYVPKGIDRLRRWTSDKKMIWNCIECTQIGGEKKATPKQVRAEVWMSLIHGSKGIIYFVHQFKPSFNEHALLDDPPMLAEVTSINRQTAQLAPLLNSPSIENIVSVRSSTPETPIDIMAKRYGKSLYIFSVGMRNGETTGSFKLRDNFNSRTVDVIGENRTIALKNGQFSDSYQPYGVHIYCIKD